MAKVLEQWSELEHLKNNSKHVNIENARHGELYCKAVSEMHAQHHATSQTK